ncbi:hypothetical protein [Pyrobaculum sp.]|uniref:hypothetical protein n=1 Tax=Pyrobaculum sp. TaxID=2004705 RepID=UPI003D0AB173
MASEDVEAARTPDRNLPRGVATRNFKKPRLNTSMSGRIAISFYVLDVTAVLLMVFGLLSALSGLCLVKPELVERATLGLLSGYAVCSRLHLDWPILATILTAVVHGVAGLDVWFLRMGRDFWWLWFLGLAVAAWLIYIYLG